MFLKTYLDQVKFMGELVQPERLRSRILLWAEEEVRARSLPAKTRSILAAILYPGKLPRGEVADIVGASDRHGRHVVASLGEHGVIVPQSTRVPLRLAFPATLASRWMPVLFPAQPS